ncbi:MAG: Hsp20/alpha crystallin family protein [Methanomicrobiales archaeon]|nr:Hsp20/alpha crystallin family protein [Methanomicrobiales archaeon]
MRFRRYPFSSIWREFDDMMAEMENRIASIMQDFEPERLLPAPGFHRRMLPALRGEFSVDVREHEDEVIVVADLPGVEKDDVNLRLVDPRTLEISSERKGEKEKTEEGYYMRERVYGSMCRRVLLPADVTEEEAKASFKNGVLEVHLKKVQVVPEKKIPVE